jgi:hypothetical protein
MQQSRCRVWIWPLVWAIAGIGCDTTVAGNKPLGTVVDSDAALQRFVRRAYIDLLGHGVGDGELADATARLREAGNTAAARGAMVDGLIAGDAFATSWISELENAIFGGATTEQQYALLCGVVRALAQQCTPCTETDACACTCAPMAPFRDERASLRAAPHDLATGTHSAVIERRYAMSSGYTVSAGTPEHRAAVMFDDFLARSAEADEIENGRAMIVGSIVPGTPAGLLFHRYGGSYADFVDIVFDSDVYREAVVRRVFDRYLARTPSPAELAHFMAGLGSPSGNAAEPDLRGVLRAVVSSREYFDQ